MKKRAFFDQKMTKKGQKRTSAAFGEVHADNGNRLIPRRRAFSPRRGRNGSKKVVRLPEYARFRKWPLASHLRVLSRRGRGFTKMNDFVKS